MNYSFNLIDENWIPSIRISDSKTIKISIKEALLNGESYQEIYDNSPLVTVAIYRLLLAICYRACDGPTGHREAQKIYSEGLPKQKISDYLDKWHHRFDLFDEKYPFLQIGGLTTDKPCSLNRLATELATGNNPTLFDHTYDDIPIEYSPDAAARLLLAAQSYALGFGKSAPATIVNETIEPPYSADASILRGITIWVSNNSLTQTMLLNFIPNDNQSNDQAIWELDEPQSLRDIQQNNGRKIISAFGIADRYVWISRLIKMIPEQQQNGIVVRKVYFTQGRSADRSPDEPMKCYVRSKEEGVNPLSLNAYKSVWRDAHALFAFNSNEYKRALVFNFVSQLIENALINNDSDIQVNVVGMATEPGKAGKFLLWRHEKMPTPLKLLTDESLVEILGVLLNESEEIAKELRKRNRELCRYYLETSSKSADKDEITRLTDSLDSERNYWSSLEQRFYIFLNELVSDKNMATNNWLNTIERLAANAFEDSAEKLGTSARAIRAKAKTESLFYSQLRRNISDNTK